MTNAGGVRWTGKAITSVSLYRPIFPAFQLTVWPFVILYAIAFHFCYESAGEPYQTALRELEEKEEATYNFAQFGMNNSTDEVDAVFETDNLEDLFQWEEEAPEPVEKKQISEEDSMLAWLLGVEEEELVAMMEEEPEEVVELPWEYQPGFWPLFLLAAVVSVHVVSWLGMQWSVDYQCFVGYKKVASLEEAQYLKVVPQAHRGKTMLVPLVKPRRGDMYFFFQKHKYIFNPTTKFFEKVTVKPNRPISYYLDSTGLSQQEVEEFRRRYGPNVFEIPIPTFKELYLEQIAAPFFVFQVFCTLLWCLDEYWKYSLFTLFMLLSFEATVVVSRRTNLTKLRGMGNKERKLLALRSGQWMAISNTSLLPGDLIALSVGKHADENVVPADCLLVHGSAVVNEATLTGESIPQMKESVQNTPDERTRELDIKSMDKAHTLFGGTSLLEVRPVSTEGSLLDSRSSSLQPPEGACVCYVLRTGFSSSQGKLVRRIEFSTDRVTANNKESLMLIVFLLAFAIAASSYVLKRGLEDQNRSRFELLLHCILIVTSVVPPELPMQLALAVNSSVMALMRKAIFCTEPFRIPLAGALQVCCFDKTGTITTDQLVAAGIAAAHSPPADSTNPAPLEKLNMSPLPARAVVAGCHSLMNINGTLTGDPLELAAYKAMGWTFSQESNTSLPGPTKNLVQQATPSAPASASAGNKAASASAVPSKPQYVAEWPTTGPACVEVLRRFRFSSKLQRMSTLAWVDKGPPRHDGSRNKQAQGEVWCLTKGSPEMIFELLSPMQQDAVKSWYNVSYAGLAKQGMRVIALAYKKLRPCAYSDIPHAAKEYGKLPREEAECGLTFAGFLAFRCLLRKDSRAVIKGLLCGGLRVIMITGDGVLTAAHVAGEVDLTTTDKARMLLIETEGDKCWWRSLDRKEGESGHVADFDASAMPALAMKYDLCTTGKALSELVRLHPETWDHVHYFKVMARMAPEQKEKVVVELQLRNIPVLMCGDGTNDVGALKQAQVGIALLCGFGGKNADEDSGSPKDSTTGSEDAPRGDYSLAAAALGPKSKRMTEMKKKHEALQKDIEARKARGERFPGLWARIDMAVKEAEEMQKKKLEELGRQKKGLKPTEPEKEKKEDKPADFASQLMKALEENETEAGNDMVKLGDASVAAPFTSKMPSIISSVDIIRQGRCTLITTVQQYQILALNSLITAHSLSVLYLDGVKYGDKQLTVLSGLMMTAFFMLSRSQPLQKLSPIRPPKSVFEPALFMSLMGQFTVHMATMTYAIYLTKQNMPPDWKPELEGEFSPNLINTVVFLLSAIQQTSVFAVNHRGPPFMEGIVQNKAFLNAVIVISVGCVVCATEALPGFNAWMELVAFPGREFQLTILTLIASDAVVCFAWDRLMLYIFMPAMLKASMEDWQKDAQIILRLVFWILALIYWLS